MDAAATPHHHHQHHHPLTSSLAVVTMPLAMMTTTTMMMMMPPAASSLAEPGTGTSGIKGGSSSSSSSSSRGHRRAPSPLSWRANTVNETITAEAELEVTVKNYDDSGDLHGVLKVGLFGDRVPMTVLNFFSLCNGVTRPQGELKYAGSTCHRLITDMHIQCGDITTGDGNGGVSIFGEIFNDENFDIGLSETGTMAMSNRGANTNGSQFFIVFRSMQSLDGRHVAFGQIVDKASLEFLRKLNEVPTDSITFTPKRRIKLTDCVATKLKKPLIITRRVAAHRDTFH
ncbi:peptidyl-prolyl cis-trans isomerase A-like [Babylonia areolata]|uniref:peptidyl-prolyl cis-trans isomerase A-like n=1 Tax=Babylonia areolata TaxID=304850 RepID=UPI003FD30B89